MLLKTLLATFLCVIAAVQARNSPVLLWGASIESKPSLSEISKLEFSELLEPLLKQHTLVVFLEKDLTTIDLSCQNAKTAQSCYAHLRNVSPKTYYANVEQPLNSLRSIAKQREYNSIDIDGVFQNPIEAKAGNVYFVNFETEQQEERGDTLAQHDAIMQLATKQLANDKIVFLYLSATSNGHRVSSISSRVRRDTAATEGGYIFRDGDNFLIFFTGLTYKANDATTADTVVFNSMTVTVNSQSLNVSLVSSSSTTLAFNIILQDGYFSMQGLTYAGVQFRTPEMDAPITASYHCGKQTLNAVSTLNSPNNAVIVWENLQFQAPFGSTTNTSFVFSDAWDCVYFFTPGILSALFVAIVLLLVLFAGICWMMDINTMDRFEDPKGKTITVNTGAE